MRTEVDLGILPLFLVNLLILVSCSSGEDDYDFTWGPGTGRPIIQKIQPSYGPLHGGTELVVTGSGFNPGATVEIGGAPAASVVIESSTRITCIAPPGERGPSEAVVKNPDYGSGTSANAFTYVLSIAGGANATYILKEDGTAWAWGKNPYGEIGDGTINERHIPGEIMGLSDVVEINGGASRSIALQSDGSLWTWGRNNRGQLGNGTWDEKHAPVNIWGTSDVVAVTGQATGYFTIALKGDGTVWAWGDNDYGQLGDGTIDDRNVPGPVPGLSGVIAIDAGWGHVIALKSDGTVWTWGYNSYGQIGDGTNDDRLTPFQVSGLTNVVEIEGGAGGYALKENGEIWVWGLNDHGQLGDGTIDSKDTPVMISSISGVKQIETMDGATAFLKHDGTVWTVGWNDSGRLGDGTTVEKHNPVQVVGLSNIIAIATGFHHGIALESDGTIWTWGRNTYGELGDGTTIDRYTPVRVHSTAPGGYALGWIGGGQDGWQTGPAPAAGADLRSFNQPSGVHVDANGYIFVADYKNHRISKWDSAGNAVGWIGAGQDGWQISNTPAAGTDYKSFKNAPGLFVDGNGDIYVADMSNDRVCKWGSNGVAIGWIGGGSNGWQVGGAPGSSTALNGFYNPISVAVDGDGTIYVADLSNSRIVKWTAGGTAVGWIGGGQDGWQTGTAPSSGTDYQSFSSPYDVHLDGSGNLFVPEWCDRISKWTLGGTALGWIGGWSDGWQFGNTPAPGPDYRSFDGPSGVFVTPAGEIFVGDYGNHRISRWDRDGNAKGWIGGGLNGWKKDDGTSAGAGYQEFNTPYEAFVDSDGYLYVAEYLNNRISKWKIE